LKDESDVRVPHFSDIEARCNVRLQSLFGPQHLPTGRIDLNSKADALGLNR
jgi:hypothetical protein